MDDTRVSGALKLDQLIESLEKTQDDEVLDFAKDDLFYRTTKEPALRKNISFVIPSKDKFIDQSQVFLARLIKGRNTDDGSLSPSPPTVILSDSLAFAAAPANGRVRQTSVDAATASTDGGAACR